MTEKNSVFMWGGDFGTYPIGDEWTDVRLTKSGYPDRRFGRGKEMIDHFVTLDRETWERAA